MKLTQYLIWTLYYLFTLGDRMRYALAQNKGCRIYKGPMGWDGSNTYMDRNSPPQGRDFLTFQEFRKIHGAGGEGC